jgi:hypothetical protein|tara:strand:- start:116 stop:289 length:174 start_codon:yes stop_codon:yes gene_type:complete
LKEATETLKKLDEDLNEALFKPCSDLGRGSKTTDLALRKDVKNQIEKKRISLLNIRK